MIIVGIDPDQSGGIVVADPDTHNLIAIHRMPLFTHPVTGKVRIDATAVYHLLLAAAGSGASYAVLEQAVVKPQKSAKGPAMTGSVDKIHQNYGALRALCELAFTRPRVIVAWPSTWKKEMGLSSDKELSRAKASELYPTHSKLFGMTKNTGLAESLLLVHWGRKWCT